MPRCALHAAAADGDSPLIQRLLDAGDDVNECDDNGWTALHHAADHESYEGVQVLVDRGADVKRLNDDHESAFDVASSSGFPELANYIADLAELSSERTYRPRMR